MPNTEGPVGKGRTLEEAFDDYAEQKAAQLLDRLGPDASRRRIQEAFRGHDAWFPVEIAVQVIPHNQWVRGFRVTDR